MIKRWKYYLNISALLLFFSGALFAQNQTDKLQIRKAALEQAVAWNQHDAAAYSALFTKDCDVVNVPGWWWKGRQALEKNLKAAYSLAFKNSQLTFTSVDVRFIADNIAIAHARWTMTGAKMPPGIPTPEKGIQTLVFIKESGKWLITGFQNTLSLPERKFPTVANNQHKN